ncbi:MAG: hypothetical protein KGJ62_01790 [Armatimonadetes bacterium]|nr:hypothetical protein [Armatimonadota bacterium]MDE2205510.1 hypothetical protein [Armatimonadota bacterium]
MNHCKHVAACSLLLLAGPALVGCHSASAAQTAPVWRYAVVFHLSAGLADYAGVADVRVVSARVQGLLHSAPVATHISQATLSQAQDTTEIWLEGNGRSAKVLWNPTSDAYSVQHGQHLTRPRQDAGTFRAIVASAKPFLQPAGFGQMANGATASVATGAGPEPPGTLVGMVCE